MTEKERKKQKIYSLPGSLAEAIEYFERSPITNSALGDHIYNEFLDTKKREWDQFRTNVSAWEVAKYLEKA